MKRSDKELQRRGRMSQIAWTSLFYYSENLVRFIQFASSELPIPHR
jgi:hypothetical protein